MFSYVGQDWTLKDISFIEIVRNHPVLFANNLFWSKKQELAARRSAWKEVSNKINVPVAVCIRKFTDMKYKYAKLKHMIYKGSVSEKEAREHKKTSKYLDGTLDFLEPHLCEILQSKIPTIVETFFNRLKFRTNKRKAKDNNLSVNVQDTPVIEVIKKYDHDEGTEPTSVLPSSDENSENESSSDIKEETFDNPLIIEVETLNQTIKKEIRDYETAENAITELETPEHILPDVEVTPDPLELFLIKYNSMNDKGTDLKQYMKDLADVLCLRLPFEKRKHFLSQIDLLVSEILEGKA